MLDMCWIRDKDRRSLDKKIKEKGNSDSVVMRGWGRRGRGEGGGIGGESEGGWCLHGN